MRWPLLALAAAFAGALAVAWPAAMHPGDTIVCGWVHPDCLGNHWLLVWVAEQVRTGGSLLHNDRYYWPVGDAPWLAGNGSEGFLYLFWHLALGWPRASTAHALTILTLDGVAAYTLARAIGASPTASVAAAPAATIMAYAAQELGAGRFSQVSYCWLAFFLAAWVRYLAAPTAARAVTAAVLLAVTCVFYWYYGFFGVLAGAVLWMSRPPSRAALATDATFALLFLALIGPLVWTFWSHQALIPGVAEVFPNPEASADSAWPGIPFLVHSGRHTGRALPFSVVVLGVVAPFWLRERLTTALAVVVLLFWGLMAGTLWPGGPFEIVYGLASPLRRFWWPYRHVVVVNLVLIALAARAADRLLRDRTWAHLALAASVPLQLVVQGVPWHTLFTRVQLPTGFYDQLRDHPARVIVETPIAPEPASSQAPLIYQLEHGKTLLTGHALWVRRVRPEAWDTFVDGNTFLAALRTLERGELGAQPFRFDAADLRGLLDRGATLFVVNREYYPARLGALIAAEEALFDALFGEPFRTGKRVHAWDGTRWTGATTVPLPTFTWPPDLRKGGPTLAVQSIRIPSLAFSMPVEPTAVPRKLAAPEPEK